MNTTRPTFAKRLLITGLLALPMAFASGAAVAQSCKNGSCGGPNAVEKAVQSIKAAKGTVTSGSIESAYQAIESVAKNAEKLNVDGTTKVRQGIGELVKTLQDRTDDQYDAAVTSYFEGYEEKAIAEFEQLAALKGLPAAKKSQGELDKEDDRSAWREAKELASKLIGSGEYGQAREPLNEMARLARRTGYTKQNTSAMASFGDTMLPEIEAGEKLVAQEQYESAYEMLIEISRLTHARKSALAARKALGQHASLPGMRQAKGEYDANEALVKAQQWYSDIANPSPKEKQLFVSQLESITDRYKGTRAADEAQQLLPAGDNAQAAR